jgi:TolB protein
MRSIQFSLIFFLLNLVHTRAYLQQPDACKIAYNIYNKDSMHGYEVYIMDADGGHKKNITNHKDVAWTYYAYRNYIL